MPGYQGNSGFGADYKYLPEPDGIFPTEAYFLLWFFIEIQPPKSLSALSPMTSSRTRTFAFPHDVVNTSPALPWFTQPTWRVLQPQRSCPHFRNRDLSLPFSPRISLSDNPLHFLHPILVHTYLRRRSSHVE